MSVTIENLTNRPVLLRFTSGVSAWVGAGDTLTDVDEVDIKDNIRVRKLEARRVIAVHRLKATGKSRKK